MIQQNAGIIFNNFAVRMLMLFATGIIKMLIRFLMGESICFLFAEFSRIPIPDFPELKNNSHPNDFPGFEK